MLNSAFVQCHWCPAVVDVRQAAVVEVGSWLFLDCPSCRCQSDVTTQFGPSEQPTLVTV